MSIKLSSVLLTILITILLTACGNDKAAVDSTNPEPTAISATALPTILPTAEVTSAPAPTEAPQASLEASPTTAPTAALITPTPKETPKPTPIATAQPTSTPVFKPTATPKAPEPDSAVAEALFKQSCTSCHGVDLGGDFGPNLQKVGGDLTKAQIITQITNGGAKMPGFKDGLKVEEIQALATWLAAKK